MSKSIKNLETFNLNSNRTTSAKTLKSTVSFSQKQAMLELESRNIMLRSKLGGQRKEKS